LKPVEISSEDVRASEMRERADESVPDAAIESVVECTPPPPPVVEPSVASAADDDAEGRRTILPPPSEDTQTLTLTRIHVTGRSQAPERAIEVAVTASESQNAAPPLASVEPPGAGPDPSAAFVAALVDVALAAGATRAAAVLPGFLAGDVQDFDGFSDGVRAALLASGVASDESGVLAPTPAFKVTANAWRMVLRGESNDFSACGTSTLDGWANDLLKSFGVGRDGKVDVKRELRRRGVAAFGMILAA
jgi:hypothetical protein